MMKRKMSGFEMDTSRLKSRKRTEKTEDINEKRGKVKKSKRAPQMDLVAEDVEPGKYVRSLIKPSVSKESKKRLKKSKSKENTSEIVSITHDENNDDQCNNILKQLNFDKSSVLSGINALFKVLEQKKEKDTQLFDLDTPIFLQLSSIKVPMCPSRTLRLPLKHSLHDKDCSVCFIVSDVKGIEWKEHEKVVEYYEKLFSDKGVEIKINKILPLHELKTEYGEFEMKRKLLATYDVFFVDGKISTYVSKHLGKIFRAKRRQPIPIILERGMSARMKYAMLRTSMNLHGRGNTYCVQIGHCNMSVQQIYDNILSACSRLSKEYPGGWDNVKVVNLKTDFSMAIPLYLSLKNPHEVEVPKMRGRRPKAFKSHTDELSTKLNSKVRVHPSGQVFDFEDDE